MPAVPDITKKIVLDYLTTQVQGGHSQGSATMFAIVKPELQGLLRSEKLSVAVNYLETLFAKTAALAKVLSPEKPSLHTVHFNQEVADNTSVAAHMEALMTVMVVEKSQLYSGDELFASILPNLDCAGYLHAESKQYIHQHGSTELISSVALREYTKKSAEKFKGMYI